MEPKVRAISPSQWAGKGGGNKPDKYLIYAMGDQADDILISFKLTEAQLKKYDVVKKSL